jgi:hypothetical protein
VTCVQMRKERKAGWFYSRVREKINKSFGGSELRPKTEREERKMVFHIAISIRDWRVIYGPILMKFQYVVPDDEGYALTGVDRWTFSPVARLFIPTW